MTDLSSSSFLPDLEGYLDEYEIFLFAVDGWERGAHIGAWRRIPEMAYQVRMTVYIPSDRLENPLDGIIRSSSTIAGLFQAWHPTACFCKIDVTGARHPRLLGCALSRLQAEQPIAQAPAGGTNGKTGTDTDVFHRV